MSSTEKKQLLDRMAKAHQSLQDVLKDVDLEMKVHEDTGWRVREIVGHVATWDGEVAKSLRAYQSGFEYLIPDLDEEEIEYNDKAVLEQKKLTSQQILDEFKKAYDEMWVAVADIPAEKFPGDLNYPWGDESGSITKMVDYMVDHAIEHRDEILKAAKEK